MIEIAVLRRAHSVWLQNVVFTSSESLALCKFHCFDFLLKLIMRFQLPDIVRNLIPNCWCCVSKVPFRYFQFGCWNKITTPPELSLLGLHEPRVHKLKVQYILELLCHSTVCELSLRYDDSAFDVMSNCECNRYAKKLQRKHHEYHGTHAKVQRQFDIFQLA